MSTDDESFHPLGQEWEDELETMLDDTEYDSDLGMEMAEDAMRVTKGELSEADFHEKYHDDVMDEFGVDDRPTEEAFEEAKKNGGGFAEMLRSFDGDGDESRRDMMKKMGAGAAAVGLGAWGTAEGDSEPNVAATQEGDDDSEQDIQWGMAIDLERCDGCLSCVEACAEENNLDQGVNWMYVLDYEDGDGSVDTSRNRLVRPCQHCTDAPCEKVCPTTARHTRDKDGLVLTDYDVCIGCRYCQVACPYGVNYFQWDDPDVSTADIEAQAQEEHDHDLDEDAPDDHMEDERDRWVDSRAPRGTMSKCTMCPTRQDGGMGEENVGTTACEEACPPDAIQFGNMLDSDSDPQTYADNPSRGRALAQTETSVPSADALEDDLDDADSDLESVLEASEDLDEELLTIMKSIEIVSEDFGEGDAEYVEYEEAIVEAFDALEDHGLDLDSEEVLVELGLGDEPDEDEEFDGPSESDAQNELDAFAGVPESNFRLLEDVGTNPNIIYLGNQPGPNAEQIEGPVAYEDMEADLADGSSVSLVDNRKEVLDEETVGDAGVSL